MPVSDLAATQMTWVSKIPAVAGFFWYSIMPEVIGVSEQTSKREPELQVSGIELAWGFRLFTSDYHLGYLTGPGVYILPNNSLKELFYYVAGNTSVFLSV